MGGNEEEVFLALFLSGHCEEELNEPAEIFLGTYMKAWRYRPSRAEPLCAMTRYYISQGNHFFGYLLSKFALEIPRPKDLLFVGDAIYDSQILLQFADCSYNLGKLEESLEAHKKAVTKKVPMDVLNQIHKNIASLTGALNGGNK